MEIWISHTKPLSGIICFWPSFTYFFPPLLSSPSSSQAFFPFSSCFIVQGYVWRKTKAKCSMGTDQRESFLSCSTPLYLLQWLNPWAPHTWCVLSPGLCVHNTTKAMITGLCFSPDYHRVAYKGHKSERIPGRNPYVSIMKDTDPTVKLLVWMENHGIWECVSATAKHYIMCRVVNLENEES